VNLPQKQDALGVKVACLPGPRVLHDFVRWSVPSLYLYREGEVIRAEFHQCERPRGIRLDVYCGLCASDSTLPSVLSVLHEMDAKT